MIFAARFLKLGTGLEKLPLAKVTKKSLKKMDTEKGKVLKRRIDR
jgi:hypothetical protein